MAKLDDEVELFHPLYISGFEQTKTLTEENPLPPIFDSEVLQIQRDMIDYRRHIHMNPELGFEEENTARFIEKNLQEFGLKVLRIAKTGVVCTIPGKSHRTLAIRADIDALPVQEVEGREYGSRISGKSHACGHDAHVAMLLGLAKYYSKLPIDQRLGSLKLLFQPAEEGPGGATPMIEQGALKDPKPEAAIAIHVESLHDTGKVGVRENEFSASADEFAITIKGRGGHGAYPHNAVDPIPVAADLISMFQRILTRESDPLEPLVLTIGTIKGGVRHNVIAPECVMTGTLRTFNGDLQLKIKNRIVELVESHCNLHHCQGSVKFETPYSPGLNNPALTRKFVSTAKSLLGNDLIILPRPQMGAEDFFEFGSTSDRIPVMMFFLGCRNEKRGITGDHHSPQFDVDEDCLKYGLQLYVNFIRDFFS